MFRGSLFRHWALLRGFEVSNVLLNILVRLAFLLAAPRVRHFWLSLGFLLKLWYNTDQNPILFTTAPLFLQPKAFASLTLLAGS